MSPGKVVPVIITWDVDPDSWVTPETRIHALDRVAGICEQNGIPATFYVTANGARPISDILIDILHRGHEIGCHGLTHGSEEDFDRMPQDLQQQHISQATDIIQEITIEKVHSFRSPRVKTSAMTLSILDEMGYWSDSSVCSQRADLISSNTINPGWLYAPRKPYHPNHRNPYRRGELGIWEVPISSAVLPFITSTMKVLGLAAMKVLFRLLYLESRRTGKPIVFLGHPIELVEKENHMRDLKSRVKKYTKSSYFSPKYIRTYGFQLRSILYRYDESTFARMTADLFKFMNSFPETEFMTMKAYTKEHLDKNIN